MPRTAMYTAGAGVLLREVVSIDRVARLVGGVTPLLGRLPAADSWPFGGESLVVATGQRPGARLFVDVVPHPWPDTMGDQGAGAGSLLSLDHLRSNAAWF